MKQLSELSKLVLVEQNIFPFIEKETTASKNFETCFAFAKKGDYTDIRWLVYTLQHG